MVNGHVQIGEVAERTGLSLRTIRYYEEVGLVVPSARSQGGFRLYAESDIERLGVIKRMKPLGFQLDEMRELLGILDAAPDAESGQEQRRRLREFREKAEQQCRSLREQLDIAEDFAATLRKRLAED
ncbi:DNA-binding transcriptional MerR regulator [Halopolyspora algeriensis]|uniref:DNA-binding transcriptional MerR regulator n=1 Tax=Halopolyspora algeriensis TaxID=1500506 RepID=A0A368VPG8_9ACTN|nr:MerR family transcriptional regulator [Halopolyspora algeriensis]RCW41030.1 DNA-binding transcriptional MerR regulator [Halopolyspora algeriensis]TQM53886.1 DNA-binding transcriptional MerR regulator [Halopolyspora algeriensis]